MEARVEHLFRQLNAQSSRGVIKGSRSSTGRKFNFGRELINWLSVCPLKPVEDKIIGREFVTKSCREFPQPRVSTTNKQLSSWLTEKYHKYHSYELRFVFSSLQATAETVHIRALSKICMVLV